MDDMAFVKTNGKIGKIGIFKTIQHQKIHLNSPKMVDFLKLKIAKN